MAVEIEQVDLEYAKADTVPTLDHPTAKKLPLAPKSKFILEHAKTTSKPPVTIDLAVG